MIIGSQKFEFPDTSWKFYTENDFFKLYFSITFFSIKMVLNPIDPIKIHPIKTSGFEIFLSVEIYDKKDGQKLKKFQ